MKTVDNNIRMEVEVRYNKISAANKNDILLFNFNEYANNLGIVYKVIRKIKFSFKKFKWMVIDIVSFNGEENKINFAIEQYLKVVNN